MNEFENSEIIQEPINQYYVKLNEENRITMVTGIKQEANLFLFNFPDDFDVSNHNHYKIVDGELVHEPIEYTPIEPEPSETDQLRADVDYIAVMTGIEL